MVGEKNLLVDIASAWMWNIPSATKRRQHTKVAVTSPTSVAQPATPPTMLIRDIGTIDPNDPPPWM
jgi:hypothetical protein